MVLGVGLAQPITTISAEPMPKGAVGIGMRSEYIHNNRFSDAQLDELGDANPGADIHSVDGVMSTSIGLAYGVSDALSLGLRLPYVRRDGVREPHHHDPGGGGNPTGVDALGDIDGMGDAIAFGQYNFYRRASAPTYASVLFGVKAPTGDHHEKSAAGERVETELQPGSGSWDGLFGLAWSRRIGRVGFDSSVLYTLNTEGSRQTDLGDLVSYNAALSYRVHGDHHHQHHIDWDLILEANGEWRQKETVAGETNHDSGGGLVYLSPGLRATPGGGWNLTLSAGLPVVKSLHGIQSEPDWRIIGSVGKAW